MNIPAFQPEEFPALKRRFPAALVIEYHRHLVESGQQENPALQAKHRFDFPDGIRLIASKDNDGHGPTIHLSLGIHESHQPAWIHRGQNSFHLRCREIIQSLQADKLLPAGHFLDTHFTPRANHYWFRA